MRFKKLRTRYEYVITVTDKPYSDRYIIHSIRDNKPEAIRHIKRQLQMWTHVDNMFNGEKIFKLTRCEIS